MLNGCGFTVFWLLPPGTYYTLEEIATRHRLYLDDQMSTSVKGTITFYGTNNESCVERPVYIMVYILC